MTWQLGRLWRSLWGQLSELRFLWLNRIYEWGCGWPNEWDHRVMGKAFMRDQEYVCIGNVWVPTLRDADWRTVWEGSMDMGAGQRIYLGDRAKGIEAARRYLSGQRPQQMLQSPQHAEQKMCLLSETDAIGDVQRPIRIPEGAVLQHAMLPRLSQAEIQGVLSKLQAHLQSLQGQPEEVLLYQVPVSSGQSVRESLPWAERIRLYQDSLKRKLRGWLLPRTQDGGGEEDWKETQAHGSRPSSQREQDGQQAGQPRNPAIEQLSPETPSRGMQKGGNPAPPQHSRSHQEKGGDCSASTTPAPIETKVQPAVAGAVASGPSTGGSLMEPPCPHHTDGRHYHILMSNPPQCRCGHIASSPPTPASPSAVVSTSKVSVKSPLEIEGVQYRDTGLTCFSPKPKADTKRRGVTDDSGKKCGYSNGTHTHPHKIPKGIRNGHAKLSDSDVEDIRRMYSEGATQSFLAWGYNTTQTNISVIVLRRGWKHVKGSA